MALHGLPFSCLLFFTLIYDSIAEKLGQLLADLVLLEDLYELLQRQLVHLERIIDFGLFAELVRANRLHDLPDED